MAEGLGDPRNILYEILGVGHYASIGLDDAGFEVDCDGGPNCVGKQKGVFVLHVDLLVLLVAGVDVVLDQGHRYLEVAGVEGIVLGCVEAGSSGEGITPGHKNSEPLEHI